MRAILDATFRIAEITATLIPQCIQRTVAKQAVEILRICPFVAGKIFAAAIAEKGKALPFPLQIMFAHTTVPFSLMWETSTAFR